MRRTSGDDFCGVSARRRQARLASRVRLAAARGASARLAVLRVSGERRLDWRWAWRLVLPSACGRGGSSSCPRAAASAAAARLSHRRTCRTRPPHLAPTPPQSCATTLLTGTVSPSLTAISSNVPAAGEGISASTLSVEISNNGSSRSTRVANFLDPADDRAFGNRLAHLGHDYRCGHITLSAFRLAISYPLSAVGSQLLKCESPRRGRRARLRQPLPTSSDARGSS